MPRFPILLSVLAVVLLGVMVAARGGPATAQGGTADGPDLAGSWRVVISFADVLTIVGLSTYGDNGTVLT